MGREARDQFELVWDANCGTGESCVWDQHRRCVWFCDIPAGRIFAISTDGSRRWRFSLPEPVGSLGVCRSGELVVALRHSIVLLDPDTERMRLFSVIEGIPVHARLNDGKVGPDGCFWVGTVDERADKQEIGVLYRVKPNGQAEVRAEGFKASNGLAWTPDGGTLFHSDSRGPWIDAWDFDSLSGRISNRRRIATLTAEEGRPDGGACDMNGNYWSAGVSAGCVNRFSPDGRLIGKISVPVPTPTMPCFTDSHLYVTSLWQGTSRDLQASYRLLGALFRLRTNVRGAPITPFEPSI
jgi:sugar lactone lactonase YvrE